MILVTTGSTGAPFDRLLAVIERFETDEEIVAQVGPSSLRPRNARCVEYLPFGELMEIAGRARTIVAHAGVGSILLCHAVGKAPIVVPRLARLREAVDDHQLVLARRLAEVEAVTFIGDVDELPRTIRFGAAASVSADPRAGTGLVDELSSYLRSVIGAPGVAYE